MVQKVLKVGTSAAITLSRAALEALGLKIGDKIEVEIDKKSRSVRIQPTDNLSQEDREVMETARDFMKRYRKDLDELARL